MNSRTLTIGRAPDNDLVLSDSHVSSHHARLVREGSSIVVEDLRSTNHTFVDGFEVARKNVSVGDSVQFSFYCSLDWNHPVVRQWLALDSAGGSSLPVPSYDRYSSPKSIPAPASQWKGPDDSYCPECGAVIRNGRRFCNQCGASVRVASGVSKRQYSAPREEPQEPRRNGIPERCPYCHSTNISKLSVHNESRKVKGGGGGCNSCLLLIIIAILAPGLLLLLGLGGALGLTAIGVVVSENLEIVIPAVVVILVISILVSVSNSRTYVCGKCGKRFK